jgi:hypothetical protein
VSGLLGVRGGIWLVYRRGVLAKVSEPPSLPIRPFENAQIAAYGRTDVGPMILLRNTRIVRFGSGSGEEWDIDIAA